MALRDKFCEFIEEAKFVGAETPAPKYDVNYVSFIFMINTHDRLELTQI